MTGYRRLAAVAAFAALIGAGTEAAAQQQGTEKGAFGIGLILGEPTGVSAKLYLSDDTAIAGAAGAALVGGGLHAHADYLLHPWVLTGQEAESKFVMPAYVGLGVRALSHNRGREGNDDFHAGLRIVGGVMFDFKQIPLDVFVEVAGILDFKFGGGDEDHGGLGLTLNAAAGARYYF